MKWNHAIPLGEYDHDSRPPPLQGASRHLLTLLCDHHSLRPSPASSLFAQLRLLRVTRSYTENFWFGLSLHPLLLKLDLDIPSCLLSTDRNTWLRHMLQQAPRCTPLEMK